MVKKKFENMFIRFDVINERDGQTDRHCVKAKTALASHRAVKITKICMYIYLLRPTYLFVYQVLPRDAMHARPVLSFGVRLAVRVRHVREFCRNE